MDLEYVRCTLAPTICIVLASLGFEGHGFFDLPNSWIQQRLVTLYKDYCYLAWLPSRKIIQTRAGDQCFVLHELDA